MIPIGKRNCFMFVAIGTDVFRKSARRRHFNVVGFKSSDQRLHATLHAVQCVEWVIQIWEWRHRKYNTFEHLGGILSCPYYRLSLCLDWRKFNYFTILEFEINSDTTQWPQLLSFWLWGRLKPGEKSLKERDKEKVWTCKKISIFWVRLEPKGEWPFSWQRRLAVGLGWR